jgi:hypothetical protein
MAKLPTRESLGGLPRTGGSPGISQLNVSGIESAGSAIAAGAANLGKGVEKIGDVGYDYQKKREDYEAESGFQQFQWNELKGLDAAKRNMQPGQADDFGNVYTEGYRDRAKQFFTSIPERLKPHYDEKLFSTERSLYGAATEFGRTEQKRYSLEDLSTKLETIARPRAREGDLDGATENWEKLVRSNPSLTPIEADEVIRHGKKKLALSHLSGLPPEQVHEVLGRAAARAPGALPGVAPLPGEDVGTAAGLPPATAEFFRARSSGRVEGLDPEFGGRLAQAAQAFEAQTGSKARFSDLKRSTEEQSALYDRYRRGEGGLAAPPGHSRHEGGYAADVPRGPFLDWLHDNADRYGLEFLKGAAFRADPVHVQLAGGRPSIAPPDAGTVALPAGASALSTLTDEERQHVLDKASGDLRADYGQSFLLAATGDGRLGERSEIENNKAFNDRDRVATLRSYDTIAKTLRGKEKKADTELSAVTKNEYAAIIDAARQGDGVMPTREEIESNSELTRADKNALHTHRESSVQMMGQKQSEDRRQQYDLAITNAKAGQGDLMPRSEIEKDPDLSDSHRIQALKEWDAASGNIIKYNNFENRVTSGGAINPYNEDDRNGVDQLYQKIGAVAGSPQEALDFVVAKTGMVPKSVASSWRGDLVSGDQTRAGAALAHMGNLVADPNKPQVFSGLPGEKELESAGRKFNHFTSDRGMSPEEATRKIIEMETPEYKAKLTAKIKGEDLSEIVKKNVTVDDLRSAYDPSFLGLARNPAVAFEPKSRLAMLRDYEEAFREEYLEHGDVELAKSNAQKETKKTWGVSAVNGSKVVMRYPPERAPAFRDIENAGERISADALKSIKDEYGYDADRSTLRLEPLPGQTTNKASQYSYLGERPGYRLWWNDKNGVAQTAPKPFWPDAKAMKQKQTEERGRAFELQKGASETLQQIEQGAGGVQPATTPLTPEEKTSNAAGFNDTMDKLTAGPRNMLGNIAKQWGARRPAPTASPTALPEAPAPGPDASGY